MEFQIHLSLTLLVIINLVIIISANNLPVYKIPNHNAEIEAQYWNRLAKSSLNQRLNERPIVSKAKNVILFLGDGMGITTITPSRILKGQLQGKSGEETKLKVEDFPYVSLIKTYNVNYQVTDSAASANAFLSGIKTNDGTIGVNARVPRYSVDCRLIKQNSISSILKWALDSGKSAGIVTTAQITDATPAAGYAHISNRDWESAVPNNMTTDDCKDIARQLIEDEPGTKLNVILGGARRFFLPEEVTAIDGKRGVRKDNRNLINDWMKLKNESGLTSKQYKFVESRSQLKDIDTKEVDYLFGLFNYDHLNYDRVRDDSDESPEPTLEEMTETAIKILSKNKNGFVLLAEGGNIDKAHHDNYALLALYDTVAFDKAITKASTMVSNKDTLTVVTADHSHTLSFNGYTKRGNSIFGFAGNDSNSKPYTTLMYGNGPGFQENREDPTTVDTTDPHYRSLAAIHVDSNAHGGEDVAAYSTGPMAHLLQGTQEQSYIAHVMAFAACIGDYKTESHCSRNSGLTSASHQTTIDKSLLNICLIIFSLKVLFKFWKNSNLRPIF